MKSQSVLPLTKVTPPKRQAEVAQSSDLLETIASNVPYLAQFALEIKDNQKSSVIAAVASLFSYLCAPSTSQSMQKSILDQEMVINGERISFIHQYNQVVGSSITVEAFMDRVKREDISFIDEVSEIVISIIDNLNKKQILTDKLPPEVLYDYHIDPDKNAQAQALFQYLYLLWGVRIIQVTEDGVLYVGTDSSYYGVELAQPKQVIDNFAIVLKQNPHRVFSSLGYVVKTHAEIICINGSELLSRVSYDREEPFEPKSKVAKTAGVEEVAQLEAPGDRGSAAVATTMTDGKVNFFDNHINKDTVTDPDSVFVFPGNIDFHHKGGIVSLFSESGGGLAAAATELSEDNMPVLSIATQCGGPSNYDEMLESSAGLQNIFARSILALWYLKGFGMNLVIPVREFTERYFSVPLKAVPGYEPSWWGGSNTFCSPKTSALLSATFNALYNNNPHDESFVQQLFSLTEAAFPMMPQDALLLGRSDRRDEFPILPNSISRPAFKLRLPLEPQVVEEARVVLEDLGEPPELMFTEEDLDGLGLPGYDAASNPGDSDSRYSYEDLDADVDGIFDLAYQNK